MIRVGIIDNLADPAIFSDQRGFRLSGDDLSGAVGGNTGNVAFVFGVKLLLRNPTFRVSLATPPEELRKTVDQLVICCANQIGPHTDLGDWATRLEQFGLPVTLIGLGAQSDSLDEIPAIPRGTARFLELVTALRPEPTSSNIGVRGTLTQRTLNKNGFDSVRTGCPSLMISPNRLLGTAILERQRAAPFEKIAVAAGNPWHGSARAEPRLVDVVDQYRGAYVIQHPVGMLQLAADATANLGGNLMEDLLAVYGRFDEQELRVWYRRNAYIFTDAPSWMRFLAKFDAAIGPRYHGIALALQAGVPGCVFTMDGRTDELCSETAVKSVPLEAVENEPLTSLVEAARWNVSDQELFDKRRSDKAKVLSDFVASNKMEPSSHLMDLDRQ